MVRWRCRARQCVAVALCLIAWGGGGCQRNGSGPLVPPGSVVGERLYVGTPLTGAVAGSPEVAEGLVTRISVRWVALRQMAEGILSPVDAQARMTVAPGSESPMPVSGSLTREVLFGQGRSAEAFDRALAEGQLGEWVEIAQRSGDVVPGATAEFTIMPFEGSNDKRVVTLGVSPVAAGQGGRGESATVAVNITGPTRGEAAGAIETVANEMAVIEPVPAADGATWAMALPFQSEGNQWGALAAVVTISGVSGEPEVVTRLGDEVRRVSTGDAARAAGGAGTLQRMAVVALNDRTALRPALVYLAGQCEARIAEDLMLVCDDEALAAMGEEISKFAPADRSRASTRAAGDLRWFMDSLAVRTICESVGRDKASPEVRSVLAIHTGDLSRRPDVLIDYVKNSGASDAFASRLLAENLIALEDSSPGVRVRAYDWLALRGRAPAGYEPLADSRSRRDALDRAMTAQGGRP